MKKKYFPSVDYFKDVSKSIYNVYAQKKNLVVLFLKVVITYLIFGACQIG